MAMQDINQFIANPEASSEGTRSRVIGLSDGRFVVVWEEDEPTSYKQGDDDDIVYAIYGPTGELLQGPKQVNISTNSDDEYDPTVASLPGNGFIVAYERSDDITSDYSIGFERFSMPEGPPVSRSASAIEDSEYPDVAANQITGVSYIAFVDDFSGPDDRIGLRSIAPDGAVTMRPSISEPGVGLDDPAIAVLGNGNLVVVYEEYDDEVISFAIRTPGGGSVTKRSDIGTTSETYALPEVTVLKNGNFVITAMRYDSITGEDDVVAWIYSPTGALVRSEFIVAATLEDEGYARVSAMPDGGFVVVWEIDGIGSDYQSQARAFNADGTPRSGIINVGTLSGEWNDVAHTADGRTLFSANEGDKINVNVWDFRTDMIDANDFISGSPQMLQNTGSVLARKAGGTITGTDGSDTFIGREGIDFLFGEKGADVLTGGDMGDMLDGGDDADDLDGEAGNDMLKGGKGDDILEGGIGSDNLDGGDDDDELYGGDENDRLEGGGGADLIQGETGTDFLSGGDANDRLFGGSQNDRLKGDGGADKLFGNTGNDKIIGGSGNDRMVGQGGKDNLVGGSGKDKLFGGASSDTLKGGSANDVMRGGGAKDNIIGGGGNDKGFGGSGRDKLTGNAGKDKLLGQSGNDVLRGGTGDDVLNGGGGKDRLFNEKGNDRFIGGAGPDVFVFKKLGPGDVDRILDFNLSQDRLDVSGGGLNQFDIVEGGGGVFLEKGNYSLFLKGIDAEELNDLTFI